MSLLPRFRSQLAVKLEKPRCKYPNGWQLVLD